MPRAATGSVGGWRLLALAVGVGLLTSCSYSTLLLLDNQTAQPLEIAYALRPGHTADCRPRIAASEGLDPQDPEAWTDAGPPDGDDRDANRIRLVLQPGHTLLLCEDLNHWFDRSPHVLTELGIRSGSGEAHYRGEALFWLFRTDGAISRATILADIAQ